MSGRDGRARIGPVLLGLVLVGLVLGVLLTSGCAGPAPAHQGPTTTVTVTSTTAVPAKRTDISSSIALVRSYVTGAAWNRGRMPTATSVVDVDDEGSMITGRLTYSEVAGASSYRRSQTVEAAGVGNPRTFQMTTRSTSTDPATVLDVLHRSGNPGHDYLLTGDAYRSVTPTAWALVPAGFGNGLGCAVPGRQVICQVSADLLANQALDPSMPTNTATTSTGTGAISSAITLRQLLALDVWRLRSQRAMLVGKASAADLDRTLIPVALSYDALPGSVQGRPDKLTIAGTVTVAGIRIVIDLLWDESSSSSAAKDVDLPVPTKALYTVLDAARAERLTALEDRSE